MTGRWQPQLLRIDLPLCPVSIYNLEAEIQWNKDAPVEDNPQWIISFSTELRTGPSSREGPFSVMVPIGSNRGSFPPSFDYFDTKQNVFVQSFGGGILMWGTYLVNDLGQTQLHAGAVLVKMFGHSPDQAVVGGSKHKYSQINFQKWWTTVGIEAGDVEDREDYAARVFEWMVFGSDTMKGLVMADTEPSMLETMIGLVKRCRRACIGPTSQLSWWGRHEYPFTDLPLPTFDLYFQWQMVLGITCWCQYHGIAGPIMILVAKISDFGGGADEKATLWFSETDSDSHLFYSSFSVATAMMPDFALAHPEELREMARRCWIDRRFAVGLYLEGEGDEYNRFYFGATIIKSNNEHEASVEEGQWYKASKIRFDRWYRADDGGIDKGDRAAFVLSVFRLMDKRKEMFAPKEMPEDDGTSAAEGGKSQALDYGFTDVELVSEEIEH
ncbi:hypothetical protein BDZ85DRAFT_293322 [Elsinoe ampelina]|uniref:Uncharacterized protein n=1 Tax=Elsinoe ampelina TaxID=302913 RepID=A0A6A6GL87_9PEZI|nr:hypothetical protein BDZ85DRAFT_293322 [Elsinoe ampelina]